MKFQIWLVSLLLPIGLLIGCQQKPSHSEVPDGLVLRSAALNQVGYAIHDSKKAYIYTAAKKFEIKDEAGKVVLKGEPDEFKSWDLSGDSVRLVDFSALKTAGKYSLWLDDSLCVNPILIKKRPFSEIAKASLKALYFNRSGYEIDSLYGGQWSRPAGHPDTVVYVHQSAANSNRPEGSKISSPGGWYDAGDYGKYIVNSSISTYSLFLAYTLAPEYYNKQSIHIPESDNSTPDIIDEALYNLDWMQTMQDPNDGGVYHKLTTKNFVDFVMPHETTDKRYVVQKSTSATLDFASTMAFAARTIEKYKLKDSLYIGELKAKANKAWRWALYNPNIFYVQPEDVSTGAYGDTSLVDEWFWAASEMYLLTGDDHCKEVMQMNEEEPTTPKWDVVGTLGYLSLLTAEENNQFNSYRDAYVSFVNKLKGIEEKAAYGVSINEFAWGSNSDVANQGMLKLVAHFITGDESYYKSALNDLDYLLGRNATGYCFVTGFGIKSPKNIHHRPSGADKIDEPVPGFLVGGPNTIVLQDCGEEVVRSTYPAKSFTDSECSYSTNEIAINWNVPLIFLVTQIDSKQ